VAQLPTPGGDSGTWGTILNTFLKVSHNASGELKPASVAAAAPVKSVAGRTGVVTLQESDVANLTTDLAAKAVDANVVHNSGNEAVAGVKTFSTGVMVPTPVGSNDAATKSYVDTHSGAGGSSSLAGDSDVDITAPANGQMLAYNAGTWQNQAAITSVAGRTGDITLAESDITNLTTDLAAAEQVSNKGVANGYAPLDANSEVPVINLPYHITVSDTAPSSPQDGDIWFDTSGS
jgi:hypothetical protein